MYCICNHCQADHAPSEQEVVGDIVLRFKPGTSLTLNCFGEWTISRHDGEYWRIHVDESAPAGLFESALQALESIDKPERID